MIRLKSKFIVRVYNNFKFPCGKYYAQILNHTKMERTGREANAEAIEMLQRNEFNMQ